MVLVELQTGRSVFRTEDQQMNPHTYDHLIFDTGAIRQHFQKKGDVSTGGKHVGEYELIHFYLLVQSSSPNGSKTST